MQQIFFFQRNAGIKSMKYWGLLFLISKFGKICRWKCSLWNPEYNNSVQVGYIFQCAFELESWTDIAVVLVPSITLKIQLLELKSSTVRKLNNHLIHLLFQTNRCFHESISLCGISKGQPTNNLFFHFLLFNSVSEFWNIIEFFKLIQFFM